jgi:CBS domain-containing protein
MVALMQQNAVSALPVVNSEGGLIGIVSEGDLMLKEGHAHEPSGRRVIERKSRRIERTKAEGVIATELMTSPAITVRPQASLAQAARLMHEHDVKRLPVVDDEGKVVGIVSRADILKVFLRRDEDIRHDVVEDVLGQMLWIDPHAIRVLVRDGVVTLEGVLERRSLIPVVTSIVRGVDGVVSVDDRLSYEIDDVSPRPEFVTPWGLYSRP